MKAWKWFKILFGIYFAVVYIFLASYLKTTEYTWIFTRVMGMVSITALFTTVLLGELRLLGMHRFFKYHHFLGMATFYFVFLHMMSAIFDKYSFGKDLPLIDFFGTNFSDKWMIALSLGALAFYMIILLGVTSAYPTLRRIGYRKWKLTHFISYMTLVLAFWHSVVLGTDFNHSSFKVFVFPVSTFVFVSLLGLLALRSADVKMDSRKKMVGLLVLVLGFSGIMTYFSTRLKTFSEELTLLKKQNTETIFQLQDLKSINDKLKNGNLELQTQIDALKKK